MKKALSFYLKKNAKLFVSFDEIKRLPKILMVVRTSYEIFNIICELFSHNIMQKCEDSVLKFGVS